MQERKKYVLGGVPKSLPAVVKATRIQEKAKQVGFEWENKEHVWKKVEEEIQELHEAIAKNDAGHIEEEFGDVMFSLINYARFMQIDAKGVLEKTNKKFVSRFLSIQEEALRQEKSPTFSYFTCCNVKHSYAIASSTTMLLFLSRK